MSGIMGHELFNYFMFNNKALPYNRIPSNNLSERSIEVAIAIQFLKEHAVAGKQVLEVGNVLANYKSLFTPEIRRMDVLDKFEEAPGVINVDLMDFDRKYDVIVSLSTVEHVGQNHYGELEFGDREAPLKAIVKIYNLLKRGGKALITVPFGRLTDMGWLIQFGNEYLELLVRKYGIPQSAVSTHFFKKLDSEISLGAPRQLWVQCEKEDLAGTYFHSPFIFANGIVIIQLDKTGDDVKVITRNDEVLQYHPPVVIGDIYYFQFVKPLGYDINGWMNASQPGFIFYGPYVSLMPVVYYIHTLIEIEGEGYFVLEITSNSGSRILWSKELCETTEIHEFLSVPSVEVQVEVRLYKHNISDCYVRVPQLLITPVS